MSAGAPRAKNRIDSIVTNHVIVLTMRFELDVREILCKLRHYGFSGDSEDCETVLIKIDGVTITIFPHLISCTGSKRDLNTTQAKLFLMNILADNGFTLKLSTSEMQAGDDECLAVPERARNYGLVSMHQPAEAGAGPFRSKSLLWAWRNRERAAARLGVSEKVFMSYYTREMCSNCVATAYLGSPVNEYALFETFMIMNAGSEFPGHCVMVPNSNVILLVFASGKVVAAGGSSKEELQEVLDSNLDELLSCLASASKDRLEAAEKNNLVALRNKMINYNPEVDVSRGGPGQTRARTIELLSSFGRVEEMKQILSE